MPLVSSTNYKALLLSYHVQLFCVGCGRPKKIHLFKGKKPRQKMQKKTRILSLFLLHISTLCSSKRPAKKNDVCGAHVLPFFSSYDLNVKMGNANTKHC